MGARGTADTSLTKAPYQKFEYTPEQLDEFVKCCDADTGPLYFMTNFMYIQHPTKGSMLFKPFDYQIGLIENYHNYRKSVNLLSRQTGKCVTENINIRVRNKNGDVYNIPIGVFYEYEAAKRNNQELPDISAFKEV